MSDVEHINPADMTPRDRQCYRQGCEAMRVYYKREVDELRALLPRPPLSDAMRHAREHAELEALRAQVAALTAELAEMRDAVPEKGVL
jgi:hypothetical protein